MSRKFSRSLLASVSLVGLCWMTGGVSGQSQTGTTVSAGTVNGEWPSYAGDLKGTRYSPLHQINAGNFNNPEVAWRFKVRQLQSGRLEAREHRRLGV